MFKKNKASVDTSMSKQNKVKRRLVDDIEAGSSNPRKKLKSSALPRTERQNAGKKTVLNNTKDKTKIVYSTKEGNDQNNNATIAAKFGKSSSKLIVKPIIQTQGMKQKQKLQKLERNRLNNIDRLNSVEIAGGNLTDEEALNDNHEIEHDGIKLSINGSDVDEEFPEADLPSTSPTVNTTPRQVEETEPGEILSNEEEEDITRHQVQSKVVKVPRQIPTSKGDKGAKNKSNSVLNKYSHLKNDPEFKSFIDEIVGIRMAARELSVDKATKRNNTNGSKMAKTSKAVTPQQNNSIPVQNFKSPSDTTLYSPGLKKALTMQ